MTGDRHPWASWSSVIGLPTTNYSRVNSPTMMMFHDEAPSSIDWKLLFQVKPLLASHRE